VENKQKEVMARWKQITSLAHQDGIKLRNALLTKCLSKTSVNKHIQEIKRIFDLALANNIIQANAMARVQPVKIATTDKFTPSALNSMEVEHLLAMARTNDQKPTRKIHGERIFLGGRLELFLLFYFGCGMRRTEAQSRKLNRCYQNKKGLFRDFGPKQARPWPERTIIFNTF
jgi:site-specific recombinase XerD